MFWIVGSSPTMTVVGNININPTISVIPAQAGTQTLIYGKHMEFSRSLHLCIVTRTASTLFLYPFFELA
jgi:hypothetical protein